MRLQSNLKFIFIEYLIVAYLFSHILYLTRFFLILTLLMNIICKESKPCIKKTCYEQKQQVERNSYRFGWMVISIALIILLGFRWYANESSADLLLILNAQLASVFFYQYKKLNHKGI